VEKYAFGGRAKFLKSEMVQDAIVRRLQVMAESSQRISEARKLSHPEIDWFRIAGFRNVLVHDYLGLDLDTVWNILENDLPDLKRELKKMLAEMG
jgi:uncharacterized protein with HEPN domain